MAWTAALGAAVGTAGAGIIGSGISAASAAAQNKQQRNFLQEMYGVEKADALAQWNRENEYGEMQWHKMNEYNSPMAQMQRFKEAGLNPNLIYGQSSTAPAIQTGRYDSPRSGSYNPRAVDLSGMANSIGAGLQNYVSFREAGARTDNLQAQNDVLKQEAIIRSLQAAGLAMDNSIKSEQVPFAKQMANDAATVANSNALSSLQSRENLVQQFTLNEARNTREESSNAAYLRESDRRVKGMDQERVLKQLEINLRKEGINPNDPMVMRMIGQLFNEDIEKLKKYFLK